MHLATLDADGPSGILWGHLWTAGRAPHDAYGTLALVRQFHDHERLWGSTGAAKVFVIMGAPMLASGWAAWP